MNRIIVYGDIDSEKRAGFTSAASGAECIFAEHSKVTSDLLRTADAVIGNLPPELLRGHPNIRWVQLTTSGADAYVEEGVLGDGTVLTCTTGAYGVGIAEYMVAMTLAMMKKIPAYLDNHRRGIWRDEGRVTSPAGKRALLVGTGDIGTAFASRLRPLGCRIVGIRRRTVKCPPEFDEMYTSDSLAEEVAKADIIALSLPKTAATHHILSEDMLRRCKAGAYLMNVGRGDAVDNEALLKPEIYSRFSGIWLDVCEREPLPEGDALFGVPNMIITPHITGGFHLDLTIENVFEICFENLRSWVSGGELRCIVDRSTGYKVQEEK